MAHAACQKWVTRKFYGEITPREISWGIFKCRDSLKVTVDGREDRFDGENRSFVVQFSSFQCGFGSIFLPLVKLRYHQNTQVVHPVTIMTLWNQKLT